ncbi:MAG: 3-methyl-2-oxobutanoate hydroxymethyltransferase [Candidatus Marinimicrobia bacterium]|nr:3-methyl-2-oxobutanoate hydroxymethyltransferase [Candidatus Neomarinimicrobiota bacterium]MBL7023587.1 3-methyl-2-oxobutanoate hydroxymethyltransferase [Candidatus Neomarinimicrobiota bacterium]MBL7109517.1 3-methyl-2-oxobutanoate hydroxymethyltransferase [Candidatus Neomarinimicrobiota bacterium]
MQSISIQNIQDLKGSETPFATLTAYDYTSAKLVEKAEIPLILVGDSASMVMLGYENTIPITVDEMMVFVRAVTRGAKKPLIIADMPFMSYQSSVEDSMRNAGRFIKEGGAGGVKLEGGVRVVPQIEAIVSMGVPVMGHLGLTPQSLHQFSGYKIQGKSVATAQQIIDDAKALESAGAFSVVLEGIPLELSKIITEVLDIPTIGIGAGPFCDGQIQVFHDILGLFENFIPKHTKRYANFGSSIVENICSYRKDIEARVFPTDKQSVHLPKGVLEKLTY